MEKKEERKAARPVLDRAKCRAVGAAIAGLISGTLARNRMSTIAEGLVTMTLAVGRVLHVVALNIGMDPKDVCRDFCDSLEEYFNEGGDEAVQELTKGRGN